MAKGTLKLFRIEMTGAWLETEQDVIQSRVDLRNRMRSLLAEGDLDEERSEEVLSALAAGRMPVEDVIVDVDEVVFLSTEVPLSENLDRLSGSLHNRYPLIGGEPDDFRGVVYVSTALDRIDALRSGETSLGGIAAPPMTQRQRVIDRFQEEDQEMALGLSEAEVVGLVTATDAMEAVVGELEDPLDEVSGRSRSESATGWSPTTDPSD